MLIRDYIDHLSEWGSDDREWYMRPLLGMLSGVSRKTLREHQAEHMSMSIEPDYDGFVESQNKLLLQCLRLEISAIGAVVRQQLGLEPMTLDTDVAITQSTTDNQGVPPVESDAAAREADGERVGIVGPKQQADIIASPRERQEEVDRDSHRSPI